MVLNQDKCHFPTLGFNKPFLDFSLEIKIIKNVTKLKVLGIVINKVLNLRYHMKKICENANLNLSANVTSVTTPTLRKKTISYSISAKFTS